jgi:hypothetical protein
MMDKDVLPFRFIGGLKGRQLPGGGDLTFGMECNIYKVISPGGDTSSAILIVTACDRDLAQDELPFPVTDEEAEEYARKEHQVDIPVADWTKLEYSPLAIGEFLVCRSPQVLAGSISPSYRSVANTQQVDTKDVFCPIRLFESDN